MCPPRSRINLLVTTNTMNLLVFVIVGALVVHDLRVSNRIHPATLWGGIAEGMAVAITITMARSGVAAS